MNMNLIEWVNVSGESNNNKKEQTFICHLFLYSIEMRSYQMVTFFFFFYLYRVSHWHGHIPKNQNWWKAVFTPWSQHVRPQGVNSGCDHTPVTPYFHKSLHYLCFVFILLFFFFPGSTALFILKSVPVDMVTAAPDYTTSPLSAR